MENIENLKKNCDEVLNAYLQMWASEEAGIQEKAFVTIMMVGDILATMTFLNEADKKEDYESELFDAIKLAHKTQLEKLRDGEAK